MARDEMARKDREKASLLDRRGYLRLAGAAAASAASAGTFATSGRASTSSDLLVSETFDSSEYADNFTSAWMEGNYDGRVTDTVKTGSHALEVRLPENNHYGIDATVDPVEAGLMDSEVRELYASYWVRFSADFDADESVSKLPGPANVEPGGGKGGDPANGTNGWSARGGFKDAGSDGIRLTYYTYHMDADGQYGDYFWATTVPRGQWVKVGQYMKLNSVSDGTANRDGQLKMWIDDTLEVEKSGLRFTEDSSLGVNYWFNVYYGGGATSPQDQSVYVDSWALSTEGLPELPKSGDGSDDGGRNGTVLELVTEDGSPEMDYEFVVDGSVTKRTSAGDNSSEGNDTLTDNGDGTTTVTGAAGNGYGDSYLIDGSVTSVSLDESRWTLRYGGETTSVAELTVPTVDRLEVSKSEQLGDDRMFSVKWAVSDASDDLDVVEIVVVEGTTGFDLSVEDVSGSTASGWELFQFPVGTILDVKLRVRDASENVRTATQTVTL